LISGLSGVGGAVVGAGATILVARRSEEAQRRDDHDAAILAFWTAAARFASLWNSIADLLPADANILEKKLLQGVRISGHTKQLVDRQFVVGDALWEAMGRVRMVATADELDVVNAVEDAVGEWTVGHPMPESFAVALPRLRRLIEGLGPAGAAIRNDGEHLPQHQSRATTATSTDERRHPIP
jgi:hypothetical protein